MDTAFQTLVHNVVHEARGLAPISRTQLDDLIRKYDNNDMDQDSFIMAIEEIDGILRNKMLPF
jgi:phosphopantothenate synthetase